MLLVCIVCINKIQGEVIYACIQCSVFGTNKVEVSWSSKILVST
jgi:hypothetical protein